MEPVDYIPGCLSGDYIALYCVMPSNKPFDVLSAKMTIRERESQIVEYFRERGDLDGFEDENFNSRTKNILSLRLSQ